MKKREKERREILNRSIKSGRTLASHERGGFGSGHGSISRRGRIMNLFIIIKKRKTRETREKKRQTE